MFLLKMIRIQRSLLVAIAMLMGVVNYAQHVPQTSYAATAEAPSWVQLMYTSEANRTEVRAADELYYADHLFEKNRDTQFYKRWMRNGELPPAVMSDDYRGKHLVASQRLTGVWEEMGPWSYDPEVAMNFQVQSPGACHVYTVEQSASNPEVVWAGTATAGAWKSVDHGEHWELMSRDLALTSVYGIAVHPEDPDRVWVGSGSGQLWRTVDGGLSWAACGDAGFQSVNRWYRDLVFSPEDTLGNVRLFAATNHGLWYTEDGGIAMEQSLSGEFMELAFHPTVDSVAYAIQLLGESTVFKRSTDGGMTWVSGAVGWPQVTSDQNQRRCEMAVTPADPDRVVVLAAGSTEDGGGFYGHYVSTDAGLTFEFECCGESAGGPWEAIVNPNILGWSEDGTGDGGQYYYDLALDVSPTDADRQFAAGINVWRTTNGGSDWSLNGHWVTWAGEFTADRYTHADVHDIQFFTRPDGTVDLWVASDGGLHYSADQGDHFEPRMYGIQGTDFWGWQSGWRGADVMVGGTYHNGTLIRNGDLYHFGADDDSSGGWLAELAGDNFRGFINPADASIGYHDGGAFRFTEDRFDRITSLPFDGTKKPNTGYWFGEYGNMEWDPQCYQCIYSPVGSELWKSVTGGASWTLVHDFGGDKIISVKVAPRDTQRIYVSQKQSSGIWRIYRTSDGGLTWNMAGLSTAESGNNSSQPIYLDVDGTNPDRAWCILTGTQNGYKVFQTEDAGETWQNLTTASISGERVISLAHQRGSDGGLYIGTTRAVYYRDAALDDWMLYNTGLPAINVSTFLQADYCGGHIRAAGTRGVHQAPFYEASNVLAAFMADHTAINLASPCIAESVQFSDVSVVRCDGAVYAWEFPGGTPALASGTNPVVMYESPGDYDVTLTVTDSEGTSDSWTWSNMIQVVDEPVVPDAGFIENFDGELFPPAHWRMEIAGHAWEHAWDLVDATNGVAQFPNYWVDTDGAFDLLISPAFDPTEMEGVGFDVAHQVYAQYIDGLEVWGRPGGSAEWTVLWSAYGNDLAVPDCYTWFWYDTGGEVQWAHHEVEFPTEWQSGVTCLELAFVNVGGYGNHTWIDNVSVGSPVGLPVLAERTSMHVYPNPSDGFIHWTVPNTSIGSAFSIRDAAGRTIWAGRISSPRMTLKLDQSPGCYLLEVEGVGTERILIR